MSNPSRVRGGERSGAEAITPGAGRWNRVLVPHGGRALGGRAPGGRAPGGRAPDPVDSILAGRAVPRALPEAATAELREIMARAEARAGL